MNLHDRIGSTEITKIQQYLYDRGALPHEPNGIWTVATSVAYSVLAQRHNLHWHASRQQPSVMAQIPETLRELIFGFAAEKQVLSNASVQQEPVEKNMIPKRVTLRRNNQPTIPTTFTVKRKMA